MPRSREQAAGDAVQVLAEKTSADMRYLFTWNGLNGSGRSAQVPGFRVGGKTGTADKVINGRYATNINFNAFLAGFPMDMPRYVVLSIVDAPLTGERGGRLAAYTAGPVVREIIRRSGAMLGVQSRFGTEDDPQLLVDY
jgi:cell division protein FtsI (penicillin-binding protein 3)